jgi:hypothetical protein
VPVGHPLRAILGTPMFVGTGRNDLAIWRVSVFRWRPSELDHHLDGFAVIHRTIPIGDTVDVLSFPRLSRSVSVQPKQWELDKGDDESVAIAVNGVDPG